MPARRVRTTTRGARRATLLRSGDEKSGTITPTKTDLSRSSLGGVGVGFTLRGVAGEPVLARIEITANDLARIDPATARFFRVEGDTFEPLWHSGVNRELGFAWARTDRPGNYVLIGLSRDIVSNEILRELALNRRLAPPGAIDPEHKGKGDPFVALAFRPLLEVPESITVGLRRQVAATLATMRGEPERELIRGDAGNIEPPPAAFRVDELKEQLSRLHVGPAGLPEEQLFFDPAATRSSMDWRPAGWPLPEPWPLPPLPVPRPGPWPIPWPSFDPRPWLPFRPFFLCDWFPWWWRCWRFCWIWPRDWWMYHHDETHSGAASGCSGITSTSVGGLVRRWTIPVAGKIDSMPCIVGGKVFVGTGNSTLAASNSGGTVYRIDLATGAVEATFTFSTAVGTGAGQGRAGVGSSVAVSGGRVFASGLDGRLYCLDLGLTLLWVTDLRNRDLGHDQPIQNAVRAEGWSSPLVANGRVYVGFGEGEQAAYGFVFCLDATTGHVQWVFCTNQFTAGVDNQPNEIPTAVASGLPAGWAAAHGFTIRTNPAPGASPWSSACYDSALDRIFIGTGNSVPDNPLPDPPYASGLLALNASTGTVSGFFQPPLNSSYRPSDLDVDVPSGPTLFTRGGVRYVCFGSKNGAFFVLNAQSLALQAWRQLLPYDSAGNPFATVDPHGTANGENYYGVFGSAAVHSSSGRLFVGLGGYQGWYGPGIDNVTTPFIRSLDWATLADAWPTTGTNPPRYSAATPPVYSTPAEAGIGSPGVVNDVVFVGTSKPGFYALAVADGHCLWSAGSVGSSVDYVMGPAISGNYVTIGSGATLYIWSL